MSRLKIGGVVLYQDLSTPVSNARVQIFDLDEGGNGHDKILDRTTDADGKFEGRSREWEDTNSKRIAGPFGPIKIDVPDFLGLEFRVSVGDRVHRGPFLHLTDYTSVPIIVPWRPPITVNERHLVHVVTLSDQVAPEVKSFYQVIEAASHTTSGALLGSHYGQFHVLEGAKATLQGFCDKIDSIAASSNVNSIDVIFSTHGARKEVSFYPDDKIEMNQVKTTLMKIPEARRRKLRTLFSTACFGATHLDAWLDVGFKAASGSRRIYADSLLSFPAFLSSWAAGRTFRESVQAANEADSLRTQDSSCSVRLRATGQTALANLVDSFRIIRTRDGYEDVRITSVA